MMNPFIWIENNVNWNNESVFADEPDSSLSFEELTKYMVVVWL